MCGSGAADRGLHAPSFHHPATTVAGWQQLSPHLISRVRKIQPKYRSAQNRHWRSSSRSSALRSQRFNDLYLQGIEQPIFHRHSRKPGQAGQFQTIPPATPGCLLACPQYRHPNVVIRNHGVSVTLLCGTAGSRAAGLPVWLPGTVSLVFRQTPPDLDAATSRVTVCR